MELKDLIINYIKAITKTSDNIEVLVCGNLMIINVDNTSLSIIPIEYDTGVLFSCVYKDILGIEDPKIFDSMKKPMSAPMTIMDKKILGYYHDYIESVKHLPIVAQYDTLRGNDQYEELLALKSTDGARFFRLIGDDPTKVYHIPVFTGFPNLSKTDKIGIVVYSFGDGVLLCQYNIYKKKINKNITQFFRILDLNREVM